MPITNNAVPNLSEQKKRHKFASLNVKVKIKFNKEPCNANVALSPCGTRMWHLSLVALSPCGTRRVALYTQLTCFTGYYVNLQYMIRM